MTAKPCNPNTVKLSGIPAIRRSMPPRNVALGHALAFRRTRRSGRRSAMLDGLRNYFYERRRGFAKTAGVFGALYLTGQYVLDRLEEMRDHTVQSQRDREK